MADYKGIIKFRTNEGPLEAIVDEYPLLEEAEAPVLVSLAGPFDLSAHHDFTTCTVGSATLAETLNLATGAGDASAVTCAEVIARINAGLSNDPARIVNGRVVIEGTSSTDHITIAGDACILIFGETSIDITGTSRVYSPTATNQAFIKSGLSTATVGSTIYYNYADCNSITLGSE